MRKDWHLFRLCVVASLLGLLLLLLIGRMLDLMILDRQFLKNQGEARSVRIVPIPAYRGMITDRNGVPFAVSTPVQSAWINPQRFHPTAAQIRVLARYLNLSEKTLLQRLKQVAGREFLYLKRQLIPSDVDALKALAIEGINFQTEYKRFYPQSETTAQLIGFTNIDDQGIEGIELGYQTWLQGISGRKKVIKDRMGRIVEEVDLIRAPVSGHDLALSLDNRIQYLAYHLLAKTCQQFEAKSGEVVVLDTRTGEVLALVNYPSFNPNSRFRYQRSDYRNRAVVDIFEPGSVLKPFSIASALETGNFTPHTVIDTRPSWMVVQGRVIRDVHDYGILDVTSVLEKSSNVGVSKMVLASPPEQLLNVLKRVGFGQRTESGYPGESEGSLIDVRQASPFVLATVSFGYGVSVTALQLVKAYAVFANQGKLQAISLLAGQELPPADRVLSAKTAEEVLLMMESVSERGTGQAARIAGYRVAGKTGTARIAGKVGYEENRHLASFIGIAPVSRPQLIVAAIIHEPSKYGYYGAAVAAPLFAEVMAGSLRILSVPTDK